MIFLKPCDIPQADDPLRRAVAAKVSTERQRPISGSPHDRASGHWSPRHIAISLAGGIEISWTKIDNAAAKRDNTREVPGSFSQLVKNSIIAMQMMA